MKDTLFSILLLLATVYLYEILVEPQNMHIWQAIRISTVFFLLMLMRNNGFYILLVLLPFALIAFRKNKRQMVKMGVVIVVPLVLFKVGVGMILMPSLGISEGSVREMLSVPFQQTARYVQEHEDEITAEEKENILAVLSTKSNTLKELSEKYDPVRSDSIKNNFFNKYATSEDLKKYFATWAKQLLKHPTTYIQAFLNLNYAWFSFDSKHPSSYYHGITKNAQMPKFLPELKNPDGLASLRTAVSKMTSFLMKFPVTAWVFRLSSYTWAFLVLFLIMLIRKNTKALLASGLLLLNQLLCFLGPLAYMRYSVPLLFCLPFVFFIAFSRERKSPEREHEKGVLENG